MIDVNEISPNGILLIDVFFKGYKDSYQNDSRRKLLEKVPRIAQEVNLDLAPLTFCLIRSVISGVGRSIGAEYHYRFKDMNSEKFTNFYKNVKILCDNTTIWNDFEILICDYVGGVEE